MEAKDRFTEELTQLGLSYGDRVLVRASLKALGGIRNPATELIEGILRTVGMRGPVVALTHSGIFQKGSAPENIFTKQSPAITGGFANALLQHHGARRSTHPTHNVKGEFVSTDRICRSLVD